MLATSEKSDKELNFKLAIVHSASLGAPDSQLELVALPHPRTDEPVLFALSPTAVMQVTRHGGGTGSPMENRSGFIGNTVQQDASFLAFTPFDPIYLLLPCFDASNQKAQELETLLYSEQVPQLSQLGTISGIQSKLESICDVDTSIPGMQFYKLNQEKTTAWLLKKAQTLLDNFESFGLLKGNEQWKSSLSDSELRDYKQQSVFKIIADVLSPKRQEQLKTAMGLTVDSSANSDISKAVYADPRVAPPAPVVQKKDVKKAASKSKPAAKKPVSTKGMTPLTSFFSKK
ncbi:hypothetical protein HDU78_007816 [Chytriomyces hyalinus]|nr:hypothetical protein HDU78_007816 [Chytriomyces hyalinus]